MYIKYSEETIRMGDNPLSLLLETGEGLELHCCDCGLVHNLRFSSQGSKFILVTIRGNVEATAQVRKKKNISR